MSKTVFFGGTFNPPHKAHREMLSAAAKLPDVKKILVVPTSVPPHKEVKGFYASDADRLNMCRLMCEGIAVAEVSDTELVRGGKSYTIDTVTELKKTYGDLSLLIGGDMLCTFTEWYRYRELLSLCEIICLRRKTDDKRKFDKAVLNLTAVGGKITVLNTEISDVSSTEIRNALKSGSDAAKLIPENISEYIKEKGLYI